MADHHPSASIEFAPNGEPRYLRPTMSSARFSKLVLVVAATYAAVPSCSAEPEPTCAVGSSGCECSDGQCFPGLMCVSDVCVQQGPGATSADGSSSASGEVTMDPSVVPETASDEVSSAGSTTTSGCVGTDGTIDCPCLAGDECLGDLECDSQQTCICLSGTPCGDSDCVDDFQVDNRHCGTCGNACMTFAGPIGYCALGECPPTLSDCVAAAEAGTCDAVCEAQGRTCVSEGCGPDGDTWVEYAFQGSCEEDSPEGTGTQSCADDLSSLLEQPFVRCCCTP
jgi:hypothetical protein